MKYRLLLACILLASPVILSEAKDPAKPVKPSKIYHKGWIDLNKNGRMDVYEDPSAPIDARIEDLLGQMTLEEKTCQMVTLYGYRRVLADDLPTPEWKNKIWKDGMGAIDEHLNSYVNSKKVLTPEENPGVWPASNHAKALNTVQKFFIEETRLGIPVDFTDEGIRGVEAYNATNFPTQLGLGHTWDRELIREVGRITGQEARLLGYTNVYAPILDVGRDQRWGRYEEVYGEDPYLVAELGVQMVKGLQEDGGVAATGKHYLGYSNNKGAREGMARTDPQMSRHEMENIHVYPWREVIGRAGLMGAMSCYNDYDGSPVQGSHYWLYERLRGDFGFRGYVVSDSDAVEYLYMKHRTAADMKEAVRQSVEAGLNVRCTFRSPDSYVLPLRELVEEGSVAMSVIDERVRDILRVKFTVGIFDHPYQEDFKTADAVVAGPENAKVALRASLESLVLLKNDGVLPLDASKYGRVLVVGPNADDTAYANLHYGPRHTENVSVYGGLATALEGKAEVRYVKGCEVVDKSWPDSELIPVEPDAEEQAQIDEAIAAARGSDLIVAVVGGNRRTCGENRSRSSLELPGHQNRLLMELKKTGKPLVVVLVNGRPLSINWADRNANAILEAWYPGQYGGTAVAMALLGDYNPGGKLTVTFPKTVGQIPFNFPYKPNSQIDADNKPGVDGTQARVNGALYNFGYGLSYTTFKYSGLKLSSTAIKPGESVEVSVDVTNTGDRAGDEIVQLYLHDRVSSITVYEKLLRGFERVSLEPGETKTVKFTLGPEAFKILDADFKFVFEPGEYNVMVRASSEDLGLQQRLLMLNPDGSVPAGCSASSDDGPFPVSLGRGDFVTVPVDQEREIKGILLEWGPDSDCRIDIQTTFGGGLYTTVDRANVRTGNSVERLFKTPVRASELRLLVASGRLAADKLTVIY